MKKIARKLFIIIILIIIATIKITGFTSDLTVYILNNILFIIKLVLSLIGVFSLMIITSIIIVFLIEKLSDIIRGIRGTK